MPVPGGWRPHDGAGGAGHSSTGSAWGDAGVVDHAIDVAGQPLAALREGGDDRRLLRHVALDADRLASTPLDEGLLWEQVLHGPGHQAHRPAGVGEGQGDAARNPELDVVRIVVEAVPRAAAPSPAARQGGVTEGSGSGSVSSQQGQWSWRGVLLVAVVGEVWAHSLPLYLDPAPGITTTGLAMLLCFTGATTAVM